MLILKMHFICFGFGCKFQIPIPKANIVPWETVKPRSWEIDSYLRTGTIHLISCATSTLQSLVQLLGNKKA